LCKLEEMYLSILSMKAATYAQRRER